MKTVPEAIPEKRDNATKAQFLARRLFEVPANVIGRPRPVSRIAFKGPVVAGKELDYGGLAEAPLVDRLLQALNEWDATKNT